MKDDQLGWDVVVLESKKKFLGLAERADKILFAVNDESRSFNPVSVFDGGAIPIIIVVFPDGTAELQVYRSGGKC